MFVCISPNPAIDKRLRLSKLTPGRMNRAASATAAPGGKATHVAMVLRTLGADPVWIGFYGGASGRELLEGLRLLGVRAQPIRTLQCTRLNFEIIDDDGTTTEVLEPGASPSEWEIASFEETCEKQFALGTNQAIVVASGSLPPGMRNDFYAALIQRAHAHGCKLYLDASGEALGQALAVGPDFVKPNREEAELLTGTKIVDRASAVEAMHRLFNAGAKGVAISLGAGGVYWSPGKGQEMYFAAAIPTPVRSSVGCGDATVAAFAYAAAATYSPEETLRLAVACGAANTLADSPGAASNDDIRRFQKEVCVERLS